MILPLISVNPLKIAIWEQSPIFVRIYAFKDVDLLDQEERRLILEELRALNPRCSFPTIVINERVIVGYREDQIKEALGL